jgi:hypothetical protein
MISVTLAEYMDVIPSMHVKVTSMQQVGENWLTDDEKYWYTHSIEIMLLRNECRKNTASA